MKETAIVWFRNDLRLHDNEALVKAISSADNIIPIYVFDERIFNGKTKFGFRKTEKYRTKFIIEAVQNLRDNLKMLGADLLVRVGKPEVIVLEVARKFNSSWVFCNRERTYEEEKVQDKLEKGLWEKGQEIFYTRGKMLYYTSDLPFPVQHTPDVFTSFRKEVEKFIPIRDPLPKPTCIPNQYKDQIEWGSMPSLKDFGHDETNYDSFFIGGEDAGLKQLNYYLWDKDLLKIYKETRNGLLGWDYSSKFSPWLSAGCLSPKQIYHEVKKYESKRVANESTYWLVFELLWRDFFRLIAKKYGNKIFHQGGLRNVELNYKNDENLFNKWIEGKTGVPFIDANMIELKETGFMSNRGRQNVASFLVHDLKINWLKGAEYFESILIDYDPCSNYGNWNYIAGIGNDPREDRYFNVVNQGKRYDPDGKYVKKWLPELKNIESDFIHTPQILSKGMQERFHFRVGVDYPLPVITVKV
jgi:deoxyribodipyrimidine photo-lyase